MLRYGKVIRHLSKITGNTWNSWEYRSFGYTGIVGVRRSYSNTSDKKPPKSTVTTLKAEECLPQKEPSSTSSFSGSGCPIDPNCDCPLHPANESGKLTKESGLQSTECPKGDPNKKKPYLDWKYLLAALIIAGATLYLVNQVGRTKTNEHVTLNSKKTKKKERTKIKVPAESSQIPTEIPYLLIGGGTAAFSAFRSIKSRDPTAKVLVVTEEEDLPYMRPPLSKELWYNKDRETTEKLKFKQWNGSDRSLFYEPPEFYADVSNLANSSKGGVGVALGWKIKQVDAVNKIAILEDGYEIKYDKCLLATGAYPKNLSVFETAADDVKSKILLFRTIQDFIKLEEKIHDPNVKNIVVIGGGFLGSEIACSLARNTNRETKNIYQIYKEKHIMAQVLPTYLSEWTTSKVALEGIKIVSSVEVQDVQMAQDRLKLILTDGSSLDADQVIVAVGAEANTKLAEPSNLEVHPEVGGFLVNAELEARSNLWVAGDAACFYDIRLGRRRVEHHDHAVISGRLAGENMTGAGKPYLHQSMFWSDLGPDVGYEAIGIVDSSLPTVGVFAKATKQDSPTPDKNSPGENSKSTSEERLQPENESTGESINSQALSTSSKMTEKKSSIDDPANDFTKGVVFYLRDDIVVGIVLWNIFSRMSIARQVLASGTKYDDLNEVAKLFTIHED